MILLPAVLSLSLAQPPPAPPPRAVVVISDLHLGPGLEGQRDPGAGPDAERRWDHYEDFRWAAELDAFLKSLPAVAPGPLDLVVAGDAFELWQSRDGGCPELGDRNLGCTEAAVTARLERALADHAAAVEALSGFAAVPGNRVVFLPGNHDVGLLFPEAEKRLLAAVPGATFARKGYWLSDDGGVIVDHGHMIGEEPNRFDGWPEPFRGCGGARHLQRPWGEQFVMSFYDRWEDRFPIIDNVSESLAGAKLGMEAVGVPKTIAAAKDFFRFFFFGVSLRQFRGILGPETGARPPTWNLKTLRREGDVALANVLPPEDPMAALVRDGAFADALREANLDRVIDAFDDAELEALCNKEFVNRTIRRKQGEDVPSAPCPVKGTLGGDGDLGAMAQSLLGLQEKALADRLRKLRRETREDFSTYVFGHTHGAREPRRAVAKGSWKPVAVNDGAWQRVVTPKQIDEWRKLPDGKRRSAAEALAIALDRLPPCYTYVLVPAGRPDAPQLGSWRLRDGKWGHGGGGECAEIPLEPAAVTTALPPP